MERHGKMTDPDRRALLSDESDDEFELDNPLQYRSTDSGEHGVTDHGRRRCKKCSATSRVLMVIGFAVLIGSVTAMIFLLGFKVFPSSTASAPPSQSHTEAKVNTGSSSKLGKYRFAAVAADAGPCSEVGTKILARCGSAVDAAIATLLCVGVENTQSMGVGGGHFMTIYNRANKTATTIIAREMAPGAANETMFTTNPNKDASTFGGLAIGVPGEIMGYWEAHQRFGKLPWKELFQPTIKMCRNGFKIGSALAKAITGSQDVIRKMEGLSEIFIRDGKLLKEGDVMYRTKLANTLERIANKGVSEFYNSSLSADIAKEVQDNGGIITKTDLSNYRVDIKEPLTVTLDEGERTVYSVRPPASGAVLEFILNIIDGYGFEKEDLSSEASRVLTYHRIIEAFKFAYAKRTELGDENFLNGTLQTLLKNMTSNHFAEYIRGRITDNMTHKTAYYDPSFYNTETYGTSHLSVLAANGDAVSVTSTINTYFGSKVRGQNTGIIYNNEMDDFSSPNITNYFGLPPSPANFIKPGKRPLSSMCPAIIVNKDGDVELVIGASGGTKITTAVALVTMQTLWFGKNIKESIDSRRPHHQLIPPTIQYEKGFPWLIRYGLKKKGHNLTERAVGGSTVQGIHRVGDYIYANSDFRKGGWPDGY